MSRKPHGVPVHGWLVIDKPAGMTSFQVVAAARRLLNAAKAGHGGTLDPIATGVLPIAFGEATKTVAYAMDGRKTYHFTIRWGEARTTDDLAGEVCDISDVRPTTAAIEAALPAFEGDIQQIPPQYSAIKVAGERAYDLAREGEIFDLAARTVHIDSFRLIGQPDADHADFEVHCGKGTYMRSLARDLAVALGTVGHIAALRRLSVGRFTLENAISLDDLALMGQNTPVERPLLPIETALDDIPALPLTVPEAQRLQLGQTLALVTREDHQRLLALNYDPLTGPLVVLAVCGDRPLAIAEVNGAVVRSLRVLNLTD